MFHLIDEQICYILFSRNLIKYAHLKLYLFSYFLIILAADNSNKLDFSLYLHKLQCSIVIKCVFLIKHR